MRTDARLTRIAPASVDAVFDVDRAAQCSAAQVEPLLAAIGDASTATPWR